MRTDDPIREAPGAPGSAGPGSAYERRLRALLGEVAAGSVDPSAAAERLVDLPFADLGFARVDHHRERRQGACEIVFAEG
jgi:hypothetical protein